MKIGSISVIIPTMERPVALERTISNILKSTVVPRQIVVVDQSIKEENRKANIELKNIVPNEIEFIYEYQSIPSLTMARNRGFEFANEEIIVYSDDDIDVDITTFENILNEMQDKNIAMIAGLDHEMMTSSNLFGYFWGTKSFRKRNKGYVMPSMVGRFPKKINVGTKTEWAMGFFFVVRKSLLHSWNIKWDEKLTSYAYAEDLDFSYSYSKAAKKENLQCIFSPNVIVTHLTSKEYRVPTKKSTYMYVINREYLSYKHYKSCYSRLATRWSNYGMVLFRIIKRQNWIELIKAMRACDKIRNDLKNGIIPDDAYE